MRRPRSEWEMREYLKRKGYEQEQSDTILNKLSSRNYIDDLDFAKRWVESRRLLKSTSKRRLIQELRAKRVADDIINQVLDADETDEQAVLRELIAKKRSQTRYQDPQKLMQYLVRQGYNYDDIKTVLRED
jgi:regulatory protein